MHFKPEAQKSLDSAFCTPGARSTLGALPGHPPSLRGLLSISSALCGARPSVKANEGEVTSSPTPCADGPSGRLARVILNGGGEILDVGVSDGEEPAVPYPSTCAPSSVMGGDAATRIQADEGKLMDVRAGASVRDSPGWTWPVVPSGAQGFQGLLWRD